MPYLTVTALPTKQQCLNGPKPRCYARCQQLLCCKFVLYVPVTSLRRTKSFKLKANLRAQWDRRRCHMLSSCEASNAQAVRMVMWRLDKTYKGPSTADDDAGVHRLISISCLCTVQLAVMAQHPCNGKSHRNDSSFQATVCKVHSAAKQRGGVICR